MKVFYKELIFHKTMEKKEQYVQNYLIITDSPDKISLSERKLDQRHQTVDADGLSLLRDRCHLSIKLKPYQHVCQVSLFPVWWMEV